MTRKRRELIFEGQTYTLSALAAAHNLAPATLAYRLDTRHLPLERALATGRQSPRQAARKNSSRRAWSR